MIHVKGFFDYCIEEKCVECNYDEVIKILYDFGYRTVAINQTVEIDEPDQKKKKKKKGEIDIIPEPFKIKPVPEEYVDFQVLNRITIVFSSQEVLHKIANSQHFKKYDIVAVLPTSSPAAAFVCSNFEADIFCFNPENRNFIRKSRKMYKQLIERGYHFELPYASAIASESKRKNIIHTAHLYHTFFKSKNIIFSSSATHPSLIRGPYDVINLGLIFGLNEHQAKCAITHSGRQVYINSVGRRHGKSVFFVENIPKKEKVNSSVISISESDEDMETDQPALKKIKQ